MLSLRVTYAIQILRELEQTVRHGERLKVTELRKRCGLEGSVASHVLSRLRGHNWVDQISNGHFLIKDLTQATLYDLVIAMDDQLCFGNHSAMDLWPYQNRTHHKATIDLNKQLSAEMEMRLQGVLISDLFQCEEWQPQKTRLRTNKTPASTKTAAGGIGALSVQESLGRMNDIE